MISLYKKIEISSNCNTGVILWTNSNMNMDFDMISNTQILDIGIVLLSIGSIILTCYNDMVMGWLALVFIINVSIAFIDRLIDIFGDPNIKIKCGIVFVWSSCIIAKYIDIAKYINIYKLCGIYGIIYLLYIIVKTCVATYKYAKTIKNYEKIYNSKIQNIESNKIDKLRICDIKDRDESGCDNACDSEFGCDNAYDSELLFKKTGLKIFEENDFRYFTFDHDDRTKLCEILSSGDRIGKVMVSNFSTIYDDGKKQIKKELKNMNNYIISVNNNNCNQKLSIGMVNDVTVYQFDYTGVCTNITKDVSNTYNPKSIVKILNMDYNNLCLRGIKMKGKNDNQWEICFVDSYYPNSPSYVMEKFIIEHTKDYYNSKINKVINELYGLSRHRKEIIINIFKIVFYLAICYFGLSLLIV